MVRRDNREKAFAPLAQLEQSAASLLDAVHEGLYQRAKKNLEDHTYEAHSLEEARALQQEHGGFIKTMWCESPECEARMKEEAGMTSRCMPFQQEHLDDVCPICGKPAEVYSRITGYYRPVQNWNDGKSQEYQDRKTYQVSGAAQPHAAAPAKEMKEAAPVSGKADRYTLFVTATCPNCRAVKPLLQKAGVPYEEKDAAQYAEEAKALGLRQAPTLVAWGEEPTLYVGAAQIKAFLREYAQ